MRINFFSLAVVFSCTIAANSWLATPARAQSPDDRVCCTEYYGGTTLWTTRRSCESMGRVEPRSVCMAVRPLGQSGGSPPQNAQGLPPIPPANIEIVEQVGIDGLRLKIDLADPQHLPTTGFRVWTGRGARTFSYPPDENDPAPIFQTNIPDEMRMPQIFAGELGDDAVIAADLAWSSAIGSFDEAANSAQSVEFEIRSLDHSSKYCITVETRNAAGFSKIPDQIVCGETKQGVNEPEITSIELEEDLSDMTIRFIDHDRTESFYEIRLNAYPKSEEGEAASTKLTFAKSRPDNHASKTKTGPDSYVVKGVNLDEKMDMTVSRNLCFFLSAVREQAAEIGSGTVEVESDSSDAHCIDHNVPEPKTVRPGRKGASAYLITNCHRDRKTVYAWRLKYGEGIFKKVATINWMGGPNGCPGTNEAKKLDVPDGDKWFFYILDCNSSAPLSSQCIKMEPIVLFGDDDGVEVFTQIN